MAFVSAIIDQLWYYFKLQYSAFAGIYIHYSRSNMMDRFKGLKMILPCHTNF